MVAVRKLVLVILYPVWALTQDSSYSIPTQWIVSDEGSIVELILIWQPQNTSNTLGRDTKIQLLQSVIETLNSRFNEDIGTIHGTSSTLLHLTISKTWCNVPCRPRYRTECKFIHLFGDIGLSGIHHSQQNCV